jgi:hypothetical protein
MHARTELREYLNGTCMFLFVVLDRRKKFDSEGRCIIFKGYVKLLEGFD